MLYDNDFMIVKQVFKFHNVQLEPVIQLLLGKTYLLDSLKGYILLLTKYGVENKIP